MITFFKKNVKLLFLFLITFLLIKYSYKGVSINDLLLQFKNIKYLWVTASVAMLLILHIIRSYRWSIILNEIGSKSSLFNLFIAEMSGLFVNIFLPRVGEATRCTVLKQTNNVSVPQSIASILIERLFDLLTFCFIILFTVLFGDSQSLFDNHKINDLIGIKKLGNPSIITIFIFIILMLLIFYSYKADNPVVKKVKVFLHSMLLSFKKVASPYTLTKLIFYSFLVWGCMYIFFYFLIYAIPGMANYANPNLLFLIFVMGILGMAAPVQGGIGAYHMLLGLVLNSLSLTKDTVAAYITISHSLQLLFAIIGGGLCFLFFLLKQPKTKK